MLLAFLVPETVVREDGAGPVLDLGPSQGKPLRLTLGITRIVEQESLELSVWGSPDQENWGAKPLAVFPQKFYCGVYSMPLDLESHPELRYLRAQWKVNRWGRGPKAPLFGFYVVAEETAQSTAAAQTA
ncbi:MAG: hypothetical protein ACUVXB_00775 [Bryobacteraceae bacterium]